MYQRKGLFFWVYQKIKGQQIDSNEWRRIERNRIEWNENRILAFMKNPLAGEKTS